MNLPEGTLDS
jgi:hypothetical protein